MEAESRPADTFMTEDELYGDAAPLDLTPRNLDDQKKGSKVLPGLLLFVVVGFVVFALFQGLSGATLFLRDADVAVAERSELEGRRFRLLGSPVALTEDEFQSAEGTAVRFTVACDGIPVDVIHIGNVAESFQMGVPVVLEGVWADSTVIGAEPWLRGANDGWYFESDRMLVKHDNEYRTDRVEEAAACGSDLPDTPES